MLLAEQITQSLASLKGLSSAIPKTVGWSVDRGLAVEADFTAVDSLGSAFRELRISAEELRDRPLDALQAWARAICQKVTYLLEHIGPLELDAEAQTVLVRSTPPTREPERTAFYEMLVQAPGVATLRRYNRAPHSIDRETVDIQVTHEVFLKLVSDIVAAL